MFPGMSLALMVSTALLTVECRSSSCCPTGMNVKTVGYSSLTSLALMVSMALLTVDRRLTENGMTVCILYVPWDVSGVNGMSVMTVGYMSLIEDFCR